MFSSTEKKAEKAYQAASALLRKSFSAENRKKAGELYLTAAQLGHADAQFRYGALILGVEHAEDPAPGLVWVEKAARQGHAGALELCVEMYSGARGSLSPDLTKAAEWAQMACEFGIEKAEELSRSVESHRDPAALFQLALKEFEGEDHRPAIADLERAAEQGYLPAQLEAARIYEEGTTEKTRYCNWGISRDEAKAMYWYEKAAEGGDPEAQFQTARSLYTQKKDLLGALSLLEKAMLQGHSGALALYRKIYLPGGGIEDFLKECGERARKGDAWAGFLCADFLSRGENPKVDPQMLFDCCREAAREGRIEAQVRCGWMCEKGIGTAVDEDAAFDWYTRAAEQGYSDGLFHCGRMLFRGAGTKQDPAKALSLFEEACEKDGDSPAAAWCGRLYLLGQGTEQSTQKALDWYEKAFRQVDKDAPLRFGGDRDADLFDLGREFFLRGCWDEARTLLEDAADRNRYINAALHLAVLARQGVPGKVEPDEKEASARFSEWLRNVKPGQTVQFGQMWFGHDGQRQPSMVHTLGALDGPIVWNVLEVQRDKALLLCIEGLKINAESGHNNFFSEAEKTFIGEGPFYLNRTQYQKYIVEKKLAPCAAVPSWYAAANAAKAHGLQYKVTSDRKLSISGTGYTYDREEREEWDDKRFWINHLTSSSWHWVLADGVVAVTGEVVEKGRLTGAAYRPAVWLSLG